jgi:Mrp family chromosome partitioning ATPase
MSPDLAPDAAPDRAPARRVIASAGVEPLDVTGEYRVSTGTWRALPSTVTRLTRAGSPIWLAARARNAWRRPVLLVAVGGLVLLVAILALLLIPLGVERVVAQRIARIPANRDTMALAAEVQRMREAVRIADSLLVRARSRLQRSTLAPSDLSGLAALDSIDFLADVPAARDTTMRIDAAQVDRAVGQLALRMLIDRARSAPLAVSFRALAQTPALVADPEVQQLVDSLDRLDDLREAGELAGGADPAFVAATAQINVIGQRLLQIAESRVGPRASVALVDTVAPRAAFDSVTQLLGNRAGALRATRERNAQWTAQREAARRSVNVAVPPAAMLAAGVVLALVVAYATALLAELRRPVVGDLGEVARLAGTRVIRYDGAREGARQLRSRRGSDRQLPPIIDLAADSFRLLHLAISPTGDASSRLVLTGDEPAVVAAVAINLASIAASDARRVLLLDADPYARLIGQGLQLPPSAGLDLIERGIADPAEVVRAVRLGRAHAFDAIVAGDTLPSIAAVRQPMALGALMARYELTIACAGAEDAREPSPVLDDMTDAVVCVRVGATRLGRLARQLGMLRARGVRVRAVLVWAADPPTLLAARAAEPRRAA